MRRRLGAALLLIVAAAAVINYLRPIPAVAAVPLLPTTDIVPGVAPSLPWPSHGEAAVGVSGLGFVASSGSESAIPAASVTKVMTALVLLEDKPLAKDQPGPGITLTAADVQSYQSDLADMQSVVKVEAGEQLSELQLLEGMLVPSANNFAETAARWDTGSLDAFVAKMNARAVALHLTHTKFADVSGASAGSVSTPSDLLQLGMVAMQNDVFVKVVALGQVNLPLAGTVYNVDSVLGKDGILGIKTGSGLNSGANFLFAANASIDGHTIVVYGCVMGQPTLDIAFTSARTLIVAMSTVLHVRRVLFRNQSVATYTTPWGDQTDLISADDVDLAEWPGMVLRQRLEANRIVIDKPLPASTVEGHEHIVLGDYVLDVPLITEFGMFPPGRFWRLTRLTF